MNSATQSFLGRYRLVKVLGQGAMGVVYEAVDTRLNRSVAIKTVLRSHLADAASAVEYTTRFEREAQAAARMSHPNVVTVHDFGEHEDISYIVMEFVRGRELAQAFEAGETFTLAETVRIVGELLAALDYAHAQGVVHRDIKPANVMLDQSGHVKLTDFGVARIANTTQDRTMPGTMVGTPSYMAPEQVLGLAVGSRADLFAAGVILYQCLTGQRPFAGGGPYAVQRKIVQDEPPPPTQLNPQLPPAIDPVVARALAKQPENRYESAAAFAHDLERAAAPALQRSAPSALDRAAPSAARPPAPPPAGAVDSGQGPGTTARHTALPPAPAPAASGSARGQAAAPPQAGAGPRLHAASAATGLRMTAAGSARSTWLPVAAGAVVALMALAGWVLLNARAPSTVHAPVATPAVAEVAPTTAPTTAPVPAPAAQPGTAPASAAVPTSLPANVPAPTDAAPVAGAGSEPAPTPAPVAGRSPPPALPAPPQSNPSPQPVPAAPAAEATAPAATPRTAPEPARPPANNTPADAKTPKPDAHATPAPTRPRSERPAAPPAADERPTTPTRERGERREALEARCSDLLQRMQLGEPLTPDQSQYFQTRCTR